MTKKHSAFKLANPGFDRDKAKNMSQGVATDRKPVLASYKVATFRRRENPFVTCIMPSNLQCLRDQDREWRDNIRPGLGIPDRERAVLAINVGPLQSCTL